MLFNSAIVFVLASTSTAVACACCAEPGFRATTNFEMEDWLSEEIARIKINGEAHLYTGACWPDCTRGIKDPQETYDASLVISEDVWQLDFAAQDAPGGTLRWTTPDDLSFFRADTTPEAGSGDAILYAEVRMRIELAGSGVFTGSLMPAELVLTGQSNVCLDASRLQNWHLIVGTEEASFHFFGDLAGTPQ
ncbi:MAG: hypothetical protein HKN27_07310 [Silicimonas sp.]|nr:hypothetical protein [Silicimonas sp.]